VRGWNPRYVAYCRAHGLEVGAPAGWRFLVWHGGMLARYRRETGAAGPLDHAAYDAWLAALSPTTDEAA
jgi:hypothetical protein